MKRRRNAARVGRLLRNPTADGDADGYMELIDGGGRTLRLTTYGGSGDEVLWAAARTSGGGGDGFLLAGQTDNHGSGGLDFYVVRTDAEGRELWSRSFGGPAIDRAFGIDSGPDGGALVAGFQGENPATMNMLLLRIDADGRELWRRTSEDDRFSVGHDVVRLADDGFAVSGYCSSYGPGDQDGFLMRLSSDGRMLWMHTYGDAVDDRMLHAAPTSDGGFALVGFSKRGDSPVWDLVVRRVDRNGGLLWSRSSFGAAGKDVIACRDGSIVAVGGVRSGPGALEDILILRFVPQNGDR